MNNAYFKNPLSNFGLKFSAAAKSVKFVNDSLGDAVKGITADAGGVICHAAFVFGQGL